MTAGGKREEALAAVRGHLGSGRLAEAERIAAALLEAHPNDAESLYLGGLVAFRAGRLSEAEGRFARAVQADPADAQTQNALGVALQRQGRLEEAIGCFRRAIALRPDRADLLDNCGIALLEAGDAAAAADCHRRAVALAPDAAAAQFNLGNALFAAGDWEGAAAAFAAAGRLKPAHAPAWNNLGNALRRAGRRPEALAAYGRALAADPRFAGALRNQARLLRDLGRFAEAETALRRLLALEPGAADAHAALGELRLRQRRLSEAVACYREAARLRPDDPEMLQGLGYALDEEGRHAEAIAAFDAALRLKPDHWPTLWCRRLSLPILYEDADEIAHHRARWLEGLRRLDAELGLRDRGEIEAAVAATRAMASFYLAYQGGNDLEPQRALGRLLHRIAAAAWPDAAEPPPRRSGGERIRVGFLSAHFYRHSVCKSHGGWLLGLDPRRFEVHGFATGAVADEATAALERASAAFHRGVRSEREWIDLVRGSALDLLIFPDIGMDPQTQLLAALRLAPVQATSWGHPVTSGLPTIDAYLSSDLMEPAGAEAHYSERLVRLANLSVAYARPGTAVAQAPPGAAARPDDVRYLCAQSLFKLLPQHDEIFPRIAQAEPRARFWFIAHDSQYLTERFRARLGRAFARFGLEAEAHCRIWPRLGHGAFLGLCRAADLLIDSVGWSGFNSSMEALAVGTPVVTLPGPLMRGRHSAAILRRLDLQALIAPDLDGYVALATALGGDAKRRAVLRETIALRRDALYDDPAPIAELARFIETAAVSRLS